MREGVAPAAITAARYARTHRENTSCNPKNAGASASALHKSKVTPGNSRRTNRTNAPVARPNSGAASPANTSGASTNASPDGHSNRKFTDMIRASSENSCSADRAPTNIHSPGPARHTSRP
ncbi:MAG: hypothetical protein ABII82_20225 [Verrucomicrobiota bacterium]